MQKTSVFTLTADLMSALPILCHIHMKDCKWGHVSVCPAWLSAWMIPVGGGCAWALEHSTGCPGSRHGTAQYGTAQGIWQAKWSSDTFLVCTLPRFLSSVKDRTTHTPCNCSVQGRIENQLKWQSVDWEALKAPSLTGMQNVNYYKYMGF